MALSIEAVSALADRPIEMNNEIAVNPDSSFSGLLSQGVSHLNDSINASTEVLQAMSLDKPVSAHEVMLVMEKAKMELRMAVEVRNKLLEAYQEVMRMQV